MAQILPRADVITNIMGFNDSDVKKELKSILKLYKMHNKIIYIKCYIFYYF